MLRLRGHDDPRTGARVAALHESLRDAAHPQGSVSLRRSGPHLLLNGTRVRPIREVRLAAQAIWCDLDRLRIGGLEFRTLPNRDQLWAFLDLFSHLEGWIREHGASLGMDSEEDGSQKGPVPLDPIPGVYLLPNIVQANGPEVTDAADRRAEARRVFFRALAGSRSAMRHFAIHRVPELRKSRAIVHEMIETLVEQDYALLGMAAIQDVDSYTFQHSVHVSILSLTLGQALGLPRRDLADLGVAALFHDLGKVRMPHRLLRKAGKLDSWDWSVMRTHPMAGARELLRYGADSELAVKIMLVSAEHHLRYDGSGYPELGEGWTQGLFSRIVSLADCYDAMTASRTYVARSITPDSVVRYMLENGRRLFDPDLLRLFVGKIGLYPSGSLVRLGSGELAMVLQPPTGRQDLERPLVRILKQTPEGWEAESDQALTALPKHHPRSSIEAGCHPLDFGVDPDLILGQFYRT
jgi:HD-GYP domain-containing protein (c-di-GMP phosphodiesterase class II)